MSSHITDDYGVDLTMPADLAADGWQLRQPADEATRYDLRTPQQHTADALTALQLRCDSLQEQIAVLSQQVAVLLAERTAVRAALERQADKLQTLEWQRIVSQP